jgi:hypothetical protein
MKLAPRRSGRAASATKLSPNSQTLSPDEIGTE